jgi:Domain of unknown function (DUF5753)
VSGGGHPVEVISGWIFPVHNSRAVVTKRSFGSDEAVALMGASHPPLDDEMVEERVAARLERQQSLVRKKPPVPFGFVLYDATLRAPIGGLEARNQQLVHLLEVAWLCNASHKYCRTTESSRMRSAVRWCCCC